MGWKCGRENMNINRRLGEAQRMDGDEWKRLERRPVTTERGQFLGLYVERK